MEYTWTFFRFQLQDSNETVIYWELDLKDRILRFKSFEAMNEYIAKLKENG